MYMTNHTLFKNILKFVVFLYFTENHFLHRKLSKNCENCKTLNLTFSQVLLYCTKIG